MDTPPSDAGLNDQAAEEASENPGQDAATDVEEEVEVVPLPTAADPGRLTKFLQELSAPEMKGRLTGAPSGEAAESYALEQLTATGLEITTQDVPLAVFEPRPGIELSVIDEAGDPTESFAYLNDFREVIFSGSGSASAPLRFIGHGDAAAYENVDVSGAIVAMLSTLPGNSGMARLDERIDLAHQKGAKGVLFVPTGIYLSYDLQDPYATAALFTAGDGGMGTVDMSLHHHDFPVAFVHAGTAKKLLGKSASSLLSDPSPFDTGLTVRLEVNGTTYPDARCKNVLGLVRGTDADADESVLLVSAHYDHLGTGADGTVFAGAGDNATGAAVVLEAATLFGRIRPKRSILFALFCGEEQGLHGSLYYTKNPTPIPNASIKLVVNIDYLGEDGPNVLGHVDNPLQEVFLGDALTSGEMPIHRWDIPFVCGSDECPFYYKGIPFLHFISTGAHYHRPTDTFENLNLPLIQHVADVVVQGIGRLAYGDSGTNTGTDAGTDGGAENACSAVADCDSCIDCGQAGPCKTFVDACLGDDACYQYVLCLSGCPDGDGLCETGCGQSHPDGKPTFDAALLCVYCDACFEQCGSNGAYVCE
jgi:hypothetical protein